MVTALSILYIRAKVIFSLIFVTAAVALMYTVNWISYEPNRSDVAFVFALM